MQQPEQIFVGLEETLIEDWDSLRFMSEHIRAVKHLLETRKVTEIHIFSFAIHNSEDNLRFAEELQPHLEARLGVKIVSAPTVMSMKMVDEQWRKCRLDDITEFIMLRGKQGAFKSWASMKHPGCECTLIDDVVPNMDIMDHDRQTGISFRNIKGVHELWEIWGK